MGKYLNMVRQARETPASPSEAREQIQTPLVGVVVPGCLITWGADGTARGPATVDFLHTDPDGTCWAFVTLPSGWVAINTKFVTHSDQGDAHVEEAD